MVRHTLSFSPAPRGRHTPAFLITRCGLPGLLAAGALFLSTSAFAQQPDPAKAAEEARMREEAARKFREAAEAQGFKADQLPKPAPAPAPAPAVTPQPNPGTPKPLTPAPATVNTPKPQTPNPALPQPVKPTPAATTPRPTPAATKPPGDPAKHVEPVPYDPEAPYSFDYTEPVELLVLVNDVREVLGMQIFVLDGGLKGQTFFFNTPITIKYKEIVPFLIMLLEQREYTMYQDVTGVWIVKPKGQLDPMAPGGQWSTTRIIHTPNIKPSSLQANITALLGAGRAGQAVGGQPIFMDDLGIIIMTETPRITALVEDFVGRIVEERAANKFYRFELQNISAAAAKDRVLELLGVQAQQRTGGPPGLTAQPVAGGGIGGPGGSITNLGERITVDPTSNTLFLRGREDERTLLSSLLDVVDRPNEMDARFYPVGYKTALAVAAQGKAEQLGSVTEFEADSSRGTGAGGGGGLRAGGTPGGSSSSSSSSADALAAGAGFILYPEAGGFMYRGTESQHRRVETLVASLKVISAGDPITYEFYKLKHGKSTDVAEIIQNLISNTGGTGNKSGGILGGGLGGRNNNQPRRPQQPSGAKTAATPASAAGESGGSSSAAAGGTLGEIDGADVFVLADEPNNQILVKAPQKLQHQFRTLISKIDLRRPQVYIDAKIVVVSTTDDFRLAIEAQQIIGQFAFNTNFGLGSLTSTSGTGDTATTTGGITSRKSVATGLAGITSALVRSKDVPLIVNAMAKNIDTRIVATPQLLVDDNEEAEISSLDQQPTGTTSQSSSAGSTITGFQGFESAGPKLKVKPQISEGGYMRLEYSIELSSFNGAASGNLPPPKLENKIDSKSVTVPTDATIVVGGLTFIQTGHTTLKVPLLGDLPLVGHLFRDDSSSERNSTLYVFITPKIMRDPSFADLRLLTRAPLIAVNLPAEYPPAEPEAIPVVDIARFDHDRRIKEEALKNKTPAPISPAKGTPVRRDDPTSDEPH